MLDCYHYHLKFLSHEKNNSWKNLLFNRFLMNLFDEYCAIMKIKSLNVDLLNIIVLILNIMIMNE